MNFECFIVFILYVCYVSSKNIAEETRIIGGQDATKPYPYMASIQVFHENSVWQDRYEHDCGGAIITSRHILTAAHCVWSNGELSSVDSYSILVGAMKIRQLDGQEGTRYYPCKSVIHPNYVTDGGYDIAIITVKGTIKFVPNKVESIKYTNDIIGCNVKAVITGWGYYEPGGHLSYDLKELHTLTISDQKCYQKYHEAGYGIRENYICTFFKASEDTCSGDSGSPVVDEEENRLIGVHSRGLCGKGFPSIHERVSVFYSWIQENSQV